MSRLPGSTVAPRPFGVATSRVWPAAVIDRCSSMSSSAQNPVGCAVPSASVSVSAPVTTISTRDMCFSFVGGSGSTNRLESNRPDIDRIPYARSRVIDLLMETRMPDLDLLGTFLEIYRLGSITSAAASLGVSQPSVSERLARLEAQLGASPLRPLFARGHAHRDRRSTGRAHRRPHRSTSTGDGRSGRPADGNRADRRRQRCDREQGHPGARPPHPQRDLLRIHARTRAAADRRPGARPAGPGDRLDPAGASGGSLPRARRRGVRAGRRAQPRRRHRPGAAAQRSCRGAPPPSAGRLRQRALHRAPLLAQPVRQPARRTR